jgi:hypothetical protein
MYDAGVVRTCFGGDMESEESLRQRSTRYIWSFGRGCYTSTHTSRDAHQELGGLALEKRVGELGGAPVNEVVR